ncbi:hypothetical protein BKA82DRAFT_4151633 [Pisolithus tinctorius]|nr:hypothetical protein BKA82DRAFT_4151633 [Pisolithus tinctorius]
MANLEKGQLEPSRLAPSPLPHSTDAMSGIGVTHDDGPDRMPDLEPLSEAPSETHSAPCSWPDNFTQPPLHLSDRPVSPDLGQGVRWKRFTNAAAPFKLSLVLENKGNVARDHLASERTYLAYVRTSLACASAGVALVQLFALSSSSSSTTSSQGTTNTQKFARPLGVTVVVFGITILILGLTRYFTVQAAMLRGRFPVARTTITLISVALAALVSVVMGILLAETKGS